MTADQREGAGINRQSIGDEIVEVCGDGSFVLFFRHNLREHGIAIARLDVFHHLFQKGIALFPELAEAAPIDPRVKRGGIFEVKIFDAEIFCRGPFLNWLIFQIFHLMQFLQPFLCECSTGRNTGLEGSARA